jgi:2',3'-cyclic-nucleotide 2'-phosphodiesterase / 3'-nucleotidase
MPGFYGSHLGVIDLRLTKKAGHWRIAQFQVENRAISRRDPATGQVVALVADDPAILALAKPSHTALLARADEEIGHSKIPLHSYFSLITPTPALELVAVAQADYLRKILADTPHANLPMLSAVAPFKAGGRGGPENYTDVPAGPLRLRHASDLYMHPNSLAGLHVSGQDIADWLERSASIYHQIALGAQDVPLLDDGFASFNFDLMHGLRYGINLTQLARYNCFGDVVAAQSHRITDLSYAGKKVRPDQMFALATNSYRAAGGAGFSGTGTAQMIYEGDQSNREVLTSFLRSGGIMAQDDLAEIFYFLPMQGTSVTIDLGPNAIVHLPEVPHLRLLDIGLQPSGFHRFRLHL